MNSVRISDFGFASDFGFRILTYASRPLLLRGWNAVAANEPRRDREQSREREHHRFQEEQDRIPGFALSDDPRARRRAGRGQSSADRRANRPRFAARRHFQNFYHRRTNADRRAPRRGD